MMPPGDGARRAAGAGEAHRDQQVATRVTPGMRWRAGRGRQLPAREKPAVAGPARAQSFDASAALHHLSALVGRQKLPA